MGPIIKKTENFWKNYLLGLIPPSHISDFFEFQTFLKKAISEIFEIENILMAVDPSDRHLNWHFCIRKE